MLQLSLFLGIIAAAFAFDIYSDENSIEIETAGANSDDHTSNEPAKVYLFSQTNNAVAKTSVQRNPGRKFFEKHDKFLQRYHESKSFRDLKVEQKQVKTPLFLAFHYFLFRNYYYTVPDDDPHLA